MRRPARLASAAGIMIWLLLAACHQEPTGPSFDSASPPVSPPVGPLLTLVHDSTSVKGSLIDSITITVDTSFKFALDTLWADGVINAPALIEVITDLSHEGRKIRATEILVSGSAVSWIQYYQSDGDLVYRPLEIAFCGLPGCTALEDIEFETIADSIVFQDTDAATHGLGLFYNTGAESSTGYNANDGPPPECGVMAQGICYPPPPFDAANTSDSMPQGWIHVRAFQIPAEELLVELQCDNEAPIRAEMVECAATASNPQDTVSFEWVFRPDSILVFPGQDAPKILPSSDVPGPSGPSADSWSGRVVTSGWIVVGGATATADSAQDSVHVAVQPRTGPAWETTESIIGPIQDDSLTNENHPIVNDTTRYFGRNFDEDGDEDFGWDGFHDALVISDDGPNHGYAYVDSAGYRWERSYWVNPHITPSGPVHPVYQGQKNHWDGLLAMDSAATPQALLDGVTAHERYGAGAGAGHQGRMRDAMIGDQCGNINRLLESVVGDVATFGVLVSEVRLQSENYIALESGEENVGNNYAGAEHVLGQNPNQDGGLHVYSSTLGDARTFIPPVHDPLCS